MAKHEKILRQVSATIIQIRKSFYMAIPLDLIQDSSFPLVVIKGIVGKLKKGTTVKLKMLKDKLIVEEE